MFNTVLYAKATIGTFLLCTGVSLILGICLSLLYRRKNICSQSFTIMLAILPAIVQLVIMLVNGNIGAGVAVAGAFGLVRFRSAPGTAKEICMIFLAVALGLATGMGYLVLAALFFAIISLFLIIWDSIHLEERDAENRILKITIPEDLDYTEAFQDLFRQYTKSAQLTRIKTSGMGTFYELQYNIRLRDSDKIKAFMDEIRCRNSNLTVICTTLSEREYL